MKQFQDMRQRPSDGGSCTPLSGRLAKPLLAAAIALACSISFADDATDVSRLIKSGQLDQALTRAEAFLAGKPRDAQMRFLKGLILTEKNRPSDAITVFTKLTEDYPELPEPYNNLAVLYAGQGLYDKARSALEMAIRTHPSYATAYENLGDVYAKLASQSFDKALQLDASNSTAQTKLAVIRDLIGGSKASAAAANVAKPAAPPVAPPPPAALVAARPPVAAPPPPAAAPQVVAAAPVQKPRTATGADKPQDDEVVRAINDWAKAWSSQDTDSYLASYAKNFETPHGMSRKRWETERRKRIESKGRIDVKVENIAISYDGGKAITQFRQTYSSDRLSNVTVKTVVLAKTGNKWQILEERSNP
ncbi:MAG: tetratricopeptide repeat protein [Burkholderiaceae bacterium]